MTTELAPMVKAGGLGDVVFALSKALRVMGHKVTILVPRFAAIEESGVMLARRLTPLTLPGVDGATGEAVTLYDGRLGSGVDLLLIDKPGYYDRPGVYGEGTAYADNAARFGLLCRAAVEIARQRAVDGEPFDIVHVHDWPTALVPYLLAHAREATPELAKTRSVLTLHNLGHQGEISAGDLAHFGLGPVHYDLARLEFYGAVSALKGGIMKADVVTTVSDTYARDIVTPGHADRLDGVLRARPTELLGILNGIDYATWNPATDSALVARYDADDPSNKARSKTALLRELELELELDRPLIVSIGRVAHQKGSDILAEAMPALLKLDASFVLAGHGDRQLEDGLERAAAGARDRARFLGRVSEARSHQLYAAADLVLVPSRYEPCGLVQMYAQRYGALPVASRTGGLVDSIVDADVDGTTGTGFLFDVSASTSKESATNLVGAVQRAVAAARTPGWSKLVKRVMRLDRAWDRPARRYVQVYKNAVASASR